MSLNDLTRSDTSRCSPGATPRVPSFAASQVITRGGDFALATSGRSRPPRASARSRWSGLARVQRPGVGALARCSPRGAGWLQEPPVRHVQLDGRISRATTRPAGHHTAADVRRARARSPRLARVPALAKKLDPRSDGCSRRAARPKRRSCNRFCMCAPFAGARLVKEGAVGVCRRQSESVPAAASEGRKPDGEARPGSPVMSANFLPRVHRLICRSR